MLAGGWGEWSPEGAMNIYPRKRGAKGDSERIVYNLMKLLPVPACINDSFRIVPSGDEQTVGRHGLRPANPRPI